MLSFLYLLIHLIMDSVSPTVIGPTGYGNDNSTGALAAGLMAAAALKGDTNGTYAPGYDCIIPNVMDGVCDLRNEVQEARRDVKETEAEIRRDITKTESDLRLSLANQSETLLGRFCDLDKSVMDVKADLTRDILKSHCDLSKDILETRHTLAKDILRAEYEGKLATQAAIKEINEKVDRETERTNDKLEHCCEEVREDLCAFERRVSDKFCALSDGAVAAQLATANSTILDLKLEAHTVKTK